MERKLELDGVRGLAILLVLIWHYVNREVDPNANIVLVYLKLAANVTWSGVDLFFVLSGFLIGGILLDHRTCSNYFRVFYIRRVCRIFPLYFVLIFLFFTLSRNFVIGLFLAVLRSIANLVVSYVHPKLSSV